MSRRKIIAVVDDDESVRESLPDLIQALGFDARAFSSAAAFLAASDGAPANCLVLDVAMPGMTGPELQQELRRQGKNVPIIFITAHAEYCTWPALLASGAVACLVKPFSAEAVVDALGQALGPK